MKKASAVFLSYSVKNRKIATAIENALKSKGLAVWRDVRSIKAGERWFDAIERGIRQSRGVVVLITADSSSSEWVNYEYAFAAGARIPIVGVRVAQASIPAPMQTVQMVRYTNARQASEQIREGLLRQSRL